MIFICSIFDQILNRPAVLFFKIIFHFFLQSVYPPNIIRPPLNQNSKSVTFCPVLKASLNLIRNLVSILVQIVFPLLIPLINVLNCINTCLHQIPAINNGTETFHSRFDKNSMETLVSTNQVLKIRGYYAQFTTKYFSFWSVFNSSGLSFLLPFTQNTYSGKKGGLCC